MINKYILFNTLIISAALAIISCTGAPEQEASIRVKGTSSIPVLLLSNQPAQQNLNYVVPQYFVDSSFFEFIQSHDDFVDTGASYRKLVDLCKKVCLVTFNTRGAAHMGKITISHKAKLKKVSMPWIFPAILSSGVFNVLGCPHKTYTWTSSIIANVYDNKGKLLKVYQATGSDTINVTLYNMSDENQALSNEESAVASFKDALEKIVDQIGEDASLVPTITSSVVNQQVEMRNKQLRQLEKENDAMNARLRQLQKSGKSDASLINKILNDKQRNDEKMRKLSEGMLPTKTQ